MSGRVSKPLAAALLASTALLAATPAGAATSQASAFDRLAEAIYVSHEAYSAGVAAQLTVHSSTSGSGSVTSSIGIVGQNLSLGSREVDRAWRADRRGAVTEALIAAPDSSLTYYMPLSVALSQGQYFTKRMRSQITADVRARGGTEKSLIPVTEGLADYDDEIIPFTWANPAILVEELLMESTVTVEASPGINGGTRFSVRDTSNPATEILYVHASTDGRIVKVSQGRDSVTVIGFGPGVTPPLGALAPVQSRAALGADEYVQRNSDLLQHARLAAKVATDRALGGKVSVALLRTVLQEVAIIGSPMYSVTSVPSGFRVESLISADARKFGIVCFVITAGKTQSRAVRC